MQNRFWWLIAPILFILSCKSGEKLYNKGRYDEAVMAFVKKLQKSPSNTASLQLLPDAYAQAKRWHEDKATGYLTSNDPLKWEYVRGEYRSLQRLYDAIQSSPAALAIVKPKDYRNAITGAQENAAQVRYDRGVSLLEQGDKPAARQAFEEFQAAMSLVPGFRNSKQLMDESFQRGLVNVVIRQIDVRSPYYQFSADQFRDVLVRNLQQRNINRFVQFTDERIAHNNKIQPDQYLEMRFYDFVVGQTYVDRTQKEVSREIVVGTVKDSTGKPTINRYATVKATLYINKATVVSKGLLDYQLIDVQTSNIIRTDRLPGSYTWMNQWGYYKGDERALSDEDKRMLGGEEMAPPPPQELFMQFTRPIYDQLTNDMQNLYNNI
jgi:tetratricopeptide (TPR) repeat protein